jgi:hypothetical protein
MIAEIASGKPRAHIRGMGDFSFERSEEKAKLVVGKKTYATKTTKITRNVKIQMKEYYAELNQLMTGGALTKYASNAAGEVVEKANILGTSILAATTGIASIVVDPTNIAKLKEGWYIIEAVDTDSINLYAYSNLDDKELLDEKGLLTEDPVDLTSAGEVDLTELGLTITGGSGTIALIPGNTAKFYVRPPYSEAWELLMSGDDVVDDVMVIVTIQRDNGVTVLFNFPKASPGGMSFNAPENDYGTWDLSFEPLDDPITNSYASMRETVKS